MPVYEFRCLACGGQSEVFRRISSRNRCPRCRCGVRTERLITAPRVNSWSSSWVFPNLSHDGEGGMTFESESAYRLYLAENDIYETGSPRCGRGKTTLRTVIRYGKPKGPSLRPGSW